MDEETKTKLTRTIIQGLPGRSSEQYDLNSFKTALSAYDNVNDDEARNNLKRFIREIGPVAKECGAFLAIHPDDPPRRLLGLPRIVSTEGDVQNLLGNNYSRLIAN